MDDFGDIIYFLILIVIAVAGMFGKKSKAEKQAAQKEVEAPHAPDNPWEELEKQLQRKVEKPIPEPVASTTRSSQPQTRPIYKSEVHKDSAETFSSKYEPFEREYLSYETVDDVNKLRVKKQIKESIFKKQTALRTGEIGSLDEEPFGFAPKIEFDDIEEVKKAFIYSEIFNRKYS